MCKENCENCINYRFDIKFCGKYYQDVQDPCVKPWWCSSFNSKKSNIKKDIQKKLI